MSSTHTVVEVKAAAKDATIANMEIKVQYMYMLYIHAFNIHSLHIHVHVYTMYIVYSGTFLIGVGLIFFSIFLSNYQFDAPTTQFNMYSLHIHDIVYSGTFLTGIGVL